MLNIISWNVDGFKTGVVEWLLEYIEKHQPDVFCLNETKCSTVRLKELLGSVLNGYNLIHNPHTPHQYHGVAVLINKYIVYQEVKIALACRPRSDNRSKDPCSGRLIAIKLIQYDIVVVATYNPNAGQLLSKLDYRINQWDPALFSMLQTLGSENSVIWLGDINVALDDIDVSHSKNMAKKAGFSPKERESFQNFLDESGYVDIWRYQNPSEEVYTWRGYHNPSPYYGMRLDNVLVTPDLLSKYYSIVGLILTDCQCNTDHLPVGLKIEE